MEAAPGYLDHEPTGCIGRISYLSHLQLRRHCSAGLSSLMRGEKEYEHQTPDTGGASRRPSRQ